jgi:hypothetical protein
MGQKTRKRAETVKPSKTSVNRKLALFSKMRGGGDRRAKRW